MTTITYVALFQLPWEITIISQTPLEFSIKKGQSYGNIHAGLDSLAKLKKVVFIGSLSLDPLISLTSLEEDEIRSKFIEPPYNSIIIFPNQSVKEGHRKFSNTILHPLLHYVISDDILPKTDDEYLYWNSFVEFNALFSAALASLIRKEDCVWIIDYQLLLLPNMLFNANEDVIIGYFHYSPFPSSEIIRCIPQRKEIITGLLGATLVGFQHYSYASHFLSCCTRILGLETMPTGTVHNGKTLSVGIFPTGVDVEQLELLCDSPIVHSYRQSLRESFPTKKIIIGYEDTAQIKGVYHKLASFEKFIEKYPEAAKDTILIQIAPSINSDASIKCSKVQDKIFELVSKINAKHGSIDHLPIHYFNHLFEREHFIAALGEANACLITSERDSTNDLAFEYVLSQKEHKNPLIISELVGNAANFSTALQINPWDYQGVADSIYKALMMKQKEKEYRYEQLYKNVLSCNINTWGINFVNELEAISKAAALSITTAFDPVPFFEEYKGSRERLFLLDYDGTLVDIQTVPSAAAPTATLIDILKSLSSNDQNHVYIISGRDQNTLNSWLGHISMLGFRYNIMAGLIFSAEHGSFLKHPGEDWSPQFPEDADISWKDEIRTIFEYYTERTIGSFIEVKKNSITWHYRLADPDFGWELCMLIFRSWQANECLSHLERLFAGNEGELEVIPGKMSLEVRPKLANKGEIVSRLCQHYPDVDFICCIGDDRTDEDMFKALKQNDKYQLDSTFTIKVGNDNLSTQAKYSIGQPHQVLNVLAQLTA